MIRISENYKTQIDAILAEIGDDMDKIEADLVSMSKRANKVKSKQSSVEMIRKSIENLEKTLNRKREQLQREIDREKRMQEQIARRSGTDSSTLTL